MNPHTKDYRHHAVAGEKTGSAFQSFAPRRRKVTAWDAVSTVVTVAVALIVICSLPMGQW